MTAGTYTSALGEYIATAPQAELPAPLVDHMKLVVLDSLGCGLLGSDTPWCRAIRRTIQATEPVGRSLLWGTTDRYSAVNAAMFNGSAVHGFELDDVGPGSHYGSVTTTVALGLAEDGRSLSGLDLIKAVVTGVEVGARVTDGVGRTPQERCGFHGPGLFGAFAAMATSSHALGLDADAATSAIGNVSQFTGGIMAMQHGGMGKRLLAGRAAHSGTLAAQLAANGFTNAPTIFECGYGSFPSAFSGGRDTFDLDKLVAGLGEDFWSYKIKFKFFAARGPIHPSLEILDGLRREVAFTADDVERIDIAMPYGSFMAVGWPYEPTSITSAQMNLQFCVATMILKGDCFVEHFTEERLTDEQVLDLVARIHVRHDPALDGAPNTKPRDTVMEIVLRDGTKIDRRQDRYLVGFGEDPELARRVADKFRRTTKDRLTGTQQDRLIDLCGRLEKLENLSEVVALLSGEPASTP